MRNPGLAAGFESKVFTLAVTLLIETPPRRLLNFLVFRADAPVID